MLTPVPELKSEITYEGGATRITFPRRLGRNVLMAVIGVVVGDYFLLQQWQSLKRGSLHLFDLIFFAFWLIGTVTIVGGAAFYIAGGTESLEIDSEEVRIRKELLSFGRTRRFPRKEVVGIHFVPRDGGDEGKESSLAFFVGPKEVHFANGIDEEEGHRVVELLRPMIPTNGNIESKDYVWLKLS